MDTGSERRDPTAVDASEHNETPSEAVEPVLAPTANGEEPQAATTGDRSDAGSALPPPVQEEPTQADDAPDQRFEPSVTSVRDASDEVPANLREKMLQDASFTRLGWGTDEYSNPEQVDADEPVMVDPAPAAATEDHGTPSSLKATAPPTSLNLSPDMTRLGAQPRRLSQRDRYLNPPRASASR
ncbi:hypothetical protein ACFV9C_06925 [Kribbella sp. NPDC059898]|uniref:hypothetical protein n=1 Tax=Kribbella sp. NPDC059898 TaxID=3346995 RepID=UPI003654EB97